MARRKESTPKVYWNKTYKADGKADEVRVRKENGKERKVPMFENRPIIGRDRPINGGVYLGEGDREAIVVDDSKDLSLHAAYSELLAMRYLAQKRGEHFKQNLLNNVWTLTMRLMPYDETNVQRQRSRLHKKNQKISLGCFMGGGVCRHQALLAGYMLERLGKEGLVRGKVSIDRNSIESEGGHAWVRYTNSAGKVFILDPAQRYIGSLHEERIEARRWLYERPEDRDALENVKVVFMRIVSKIK